MRSIFSHVIVPSSGQRFRSLDGLRGLAVLAVMVCHLHNTIYSNPASYSVFRAPLGQAAGVGVGIFFVLSAFLLFYNWAKPGAEIKPWIYYRRRLLRIYPAYIVALVAGSAILLVMRNHLSLSAFFLHLSFLHSWFTPDTSGLVNPAWSLPAELQFYLILPLLALLFRRLALGIVLIIGAFILQATVPWMWPWREYPWGNWPVIALPFFVGMLAAWIAANKALQRGHDFLIGLGSIMLLLEIFVAPKSGVAGSYHIAEHEAGIRVALFAMQGLVASVGAGLILVGLAGNRGWLQRFFSFGPLRAMGICGYSLFLLHDSLFKLIMHFTNAWTVLIIGFPVVLVAGAISYLLIEAPAMRLSRRLDPRPAPVITPAESGEAV
jgi:peptidoglycan/LPS O-acetylase OafA/YrhL